MMNNSDDVRRLEDALCAAPLASATQRCTRLTALCSRVHRDDCVLFCRRPMQGDGNLVIALHHFRDSNSIGWKTITSFIR